jgi:hypothetical protein
VLAREGIHRLREAAGQGLKLKRMQFQTDLAQFNMKGLAPCTVTNGAMGGARQDLDAAVVL